MRQGETIHPGREEGSDAWWRLARAGGAVTAAQDPGCPQELLVVLARAAVAQAPEVEWLPSSWEQRAALREALARNPSLGVAELFALSRHAPAAFWENPAQALLSLELPNFYDELPNNALSPLARAENAPPGFLRWAGTQRKNPGIWAEVAAHPATDAETLGRLLYSMRLVVRRAAAYNPNLPPEERALFRRAGGTFTSGEQAHPAPKLRPEELSALVERGPYGALLVAQHPRTPEPLLRQLFARSSTEWELLDALAANPSTPPELLRALAEKPSWSVLHALFRNPSLAVEEQRRILSAQDDGSRAGLARRSTLHPALLRELSQSKSAQVRAAAAQNPSLPPECGAVLVRDRSRLVRLGLARNPGLTGELLAVLGEEPHSDIGRAVARHPNTPPAVLARLAAHPGRSVARLAQLRARRRA